MGAPQKLDRSQSFGEVLGESRYRYAQNGHHYDANEQLVEEDKPKGQLQPGPAGQLDPTQTSPVVSTATVADQLSAQLGDAGDEAPLAPVADPVVTPTATAKVATAGKKKGNK